MMALATLALGCAAACAACRPRVWLVLTLMVSCLAAATAFTATSNPAGWEWQSQFLLGGQALHIRLDGLSAVFVLLIGVVSALGAIYAMGYWTDRSHPQSATRGRLLWSIMSLSMLTVVTSSNGIHFLMAWEVFAVSGYFLITLDRARESVRSAGWLYLAASHAGTACLLAFFALLAARSGSWDLTPRPDDLVCGQLFWLALLGFGLKAGFFPLHIWLPSAHAAAPSHVSAIMSGVAIKMGVYGILRFSGWFPISELAAWTVTILGGGSALIGIAFALAQNDFKRLLAYSSVENIGIILLGVGAALLARIHGDAAWGRLALAGALLHILNHGLFKSLLFFSAGSVLHATGTREMSQLGGLWRRMPWTAGLFALGAAAVAGLPPLNGFVSEWLIYLGWFDAAASRQSVMWAALPAVLLLGMAGAMALAAFVKAGSMIFLGAPRSPACDHAHDAPLAMRVAMLALATLCLLLAFIPQVVWPLLAAATQAWHPSWTIASPGAPLARIGAMQLGMAVLMAIGVALFWRKLRRGSLRRGPTWDCGYAAPTARMQYTSGSFGALATEWFRSILRPQRRTDRPDGIMPVAAADSERTGETVLEQIVMPAAARIMGISATVRRLQHGHVSSYLLYVMFGVAALAAIVLLDSVP